MKRVAVVLLITIVALMVAQLVAILAPVPGSQALAKGPKIRPLGLCCVRCTDTGWGGCYCPGDGTCQSCSVLPGCGDF